MRNTLKPYFSFTMAMTMLFVSCSQYDDNVQKQFQSNDKNILMTNSKHYSGEDIFRGIFFLEGDFVKEIPALYNAKVERDLIIENPMFTSVVPELSEQYLKREAGLENDSLVMNIKDLNPQIFEQLKGAILSKDPYKVQDKLEESALLLKSALLTNESFNRNVKIIKDGKIRGGIDPKEYDFTKKEEVEQYNEDMTSFLESDDEYKGEFDNEVLAVVMVFLVTVAVLVALLAHLVVAIGGEVVVFLGAFLWIYNVNWVENWSVGDVWEGMKNIVSDVINFFAE